MIYGTPEYREQLLKLKLSPADAAERIIDWRRKTTGQVINYPGVYHYVLVKDEYLFSSPDKLGIMLSGIYVNGVNGGIRVVENPIPTDKKYILTPRRQKKVWGREIVASECYIYTVPMSKGITL